MVPDLHVFEQERLLGSETMDRTSENKPPALRSPEDDEGLIPSPPNPKGAACQGS